ncbi:MAG TPA: pantetheine-phosphate adenylyltransferase [Kosmotogaceae bacterium]|nr:MAG: Phosphopantetheine adenylyltransferase [Thermotogales bacterium 46_20]HAA84822.1 pantetheine-phosphate adenylyltransferase [Kosmotogaceae bacterium]
MKAIYPGSFDPITYGHIDIVKRASRVFDEIIVVVMMNPHKQYMFSLEERLEMVEKSLVVMGKITVDSHCGLLVDYVRKSSSRIVIRGLRAVSDFEMELQMAHANRRLLPDFESMFFMTDTKYSFISSSIVKEIICFGGDVSEWVPEFVIEAFRKKTR